MVRACLPGNRLGGGHHWHKLGAVCNLLLNFRTGSNVGPHLNQSHLNKKKQKKTQMDFHQFIWYIKHLKLCPVLVLYCQAAMTGSHREFSTHLFATTPTGCFVWGQLFLNTGRALHFLRVKGHSAQRAERWGHLKTWLQTLPTEPGTAHNTEHGLLVTSCARETAAALPLLYPTPNEQGAYSILFHLIPHRSKDNHFLNASIQSNQV